MKMKYVIGAICVLAIGVGSYYYFFKKGHNTEEDKNVDGEKKIVDESSVNGGDIVNIEEAVNQFESNKESSVEEIRNRHEVAVAQMRESLSNIVDTDRHIETENTETLNEILDDIDKLMD